MKKEISAHVEEAKKRGLNKISLALSRTKCFEVCRRAFHSQCRITPPIINMSFPFRFSVTSVHYRIYLHIHNHFLRNLYKQMSQINKYGILIFYSNIYPTRRNVTQFILSGNCSTCFGWYLHPSSGAQTTVSTASGI